MNLLGGSGALDASSLFAALVWGGIGSAMFMFGWKQKSTIPLVAGLVLVGITYFVESALLMTVLAVVILATVFWLKKQGY